ncbi:hypothetical protein VTH06DRAFT_2352 [Thermothelomyces fergusii]
MDAYSTASAAIRDIYYITVFVLSVIKDARDRDQFVSDIQGELNHEFLFLVTFKALFFGDGDDDEGKTKGPNRSGRWFMSLPEHFQRDVDNILYRLRRCLDAYDNVALKHGLSLSEARALLSEGQGEDEKTALNGFPVLPLRQAGQDKSALRSTLLRAEARLKGVAQKIDSDWKTKLNRLEWALFDKNEIKKLVGQYREWTEKLRQVMTLILLADGRLGEYDRRQLAGSNDRGQVGWETSKVLRVTDAARRQIRGTSDYYSEDFDPVLKGRFKPREASHYRTKLPSSYMLGKFHDQNLGPIDVIMERHKFAMIDRGMSEEEKRVMKLELVRRLARLLREPEDTSSSERESPEDGSTPMYLLHCMGYYSLDGKKGHKLCLVYKLPLNACVPTTLHEWISRGEQEALRLSEREHELDGKKKALRERERATDLSANEKYRLMRERKKLLEERYDILKKRAELEEDRNKCKPDLAGRFFLAWALASTLYNIHASGWVHKDIWSRAILVFCSPESLPADQRVVPYLVGWSISRPQTKEYRYVSVRRSRYSDGEEDDSDDNDDYYTDSGSDTYDDLRAAGHAASYSYRSNAGRQAGPESRGARFNVEHELYRHPNRWRDREATFENEYDIYSLGVVLLEIGLWSTVSIEMRTAISAARRSHGPPPRSEMQKLAKDLVQKSKEQRLAQQMGSGYARIVERCLTGSFACLAEGRREREGRNVELTREFYASVVEPLRARAMLERSHQAGNSLEGFLTN